MTTFVPTIAAWDALSEAECLEVARELRVEDLTFDRVSRAAQGGVQRWVALFRHPDGAEFALLPGGHGGYGHLSSWLTCASAYRSPAFGEDSYLEQGFVRRAVTVG